MTAPDPDPAAALEQWHAIEQAATRGPWEAEESEDCWQLFGAVTPMTHPLQLIKAPKHGTPYAEYWPSEADAAFIVTARTAMPRLLGAVEAVLKLADEWMNMPWPEDGGDRAGVAAEQIVLDGIALREAITRELTGKGGSDGG